jgi:nitrate/nitrite transport system permease protein
MILLSKRSDNNSKKKDSKPKKKAKLVEGVEEMVSGDEAELNSPAPGIPWKSIGNSIWKPLSKAMIPTGAFLVFLFLWSAAASRVDTSLGRLPGPIAVLTEIGSLYKGYQEERAKAEAFYDRQDKRNAEKLAENPQADVKIRGYTGKPTYLDQIFTSLKTVFLGFLIASGIAVPIGILCGMNKTMMAAFNPLIQLFKPVSPLAWLPIVTMIVSAVYSGADRMFEKSFIISAITVSLCSLWPTLTNTALGVSSVDKDFINVARVLRLSPATTVFKVILPASLPLIFAGLRISLGVGWMVLIAAEMLAQNPGLGKFVWDEFQNGSSQSLARIMVAVLTIGLIGVGLDRIMVMLQSWASFGQSKASG